MNKKKKKKNIYTTMCKIRELVGSCCMTQGVQLSSVASEGGGVGGWVEGRLMREERYIHTHTHTHTHTHG